MRWRLVLRSQYWFSMSAQKVEYYFSGLMRHLFAGGHTEYGLDDMVYAVTHESAALFLGKSTCRFET